MLPDRQRPTAKTFRAGTHRLCTPEQTLERVLPFLTTMGITRIANVTGLDRIGVPVVMVCRPNSRSLAVSQGKGLTLAAAKASGLMESVESWHAERVTLPLKLASYADMRSRHVVADVDELNRCQPSSFHSHLPILWVEGLDLLQQEPIWVPYELVHTDFTLPLPAGHGCFAASSNGLASGNHILEAISHGIAEVVERDALTFWRLAPPAVQERGRMAMDGITDPGCREVIDRCTRAGMDVGIWESISDVGVPTFVCKLKDREDDRHRPATEFSGYGCHVSRPIALLRALTEAVQSRLTLIAGSRDDMGNSDYEARVRAPTTPWWQETGPQRRLDDGPGLEAATFDEDVLWQLERLRNVGVQRVVAVDLTLPEVGVPVVHVIIPGMEAAGLLSTPLGRRGRRYQEQLTESNR